MEVPFAYPEAQRIAEESNKTDMLVKRLKQLAPLFVVWSALKEFGLVADEPPAEGSVVIY